MKQEVRERCLRRMTPQWDEAVTAVTRRPSVQSDRLTRGSVETDTSSL